MFVVAFPYSTLKQTMGSKHFFFFLFFFRPFYIDMILFLSFLLFVFVSVEVTQLAIYQWAGV